MSRAYNPFETSLYERCAATRLEPFEVESFSIDGDYITIETFAENVPSSMSVAILGNAPQLGEWCAERAIIMADGECPIWRARVLATSFDWSEFKFVIIERASGRVVEWEVGRNREFSFRDVERAGGVLTCSSPILEMPKWRGRGVAIPLFSLRSESSMGVGDLADLKRMVDWAAERSMSVIQILPINDTTMNHTWQDSYPYNANSTIAIHPQYLSLRDVAEIQDEAKRCDFDIRAEHLNALEQLDYEAVNALKMEYLREAYEQSKGSYKRTISYREFVAQNSSWLEPYALFSYLREVHGTPDFTTWSGETKYSKTLLTSYLNSRKALKEIEFYYFVQYHLHLQLTDVAEYAKSRGVALKGDIPIGISRTSVDAWQYPELFRMDMQAGAPPDVFSTLGQNWGFPTYRWERMAKDNYRWWRERLAKMGEYFDAYRIDHILGFFRIWQIPTDSVHGLLGHFSPAIPLSEQEIREWGFELDKSHLEPYITDEVLAKLFTPEEMDSVKREWLTKIKGSERYRLKRVCSTQRKMEALALSQSMMSLCDEVLFVEDSDRKGHYHPRISGDLSMAYQALPVVQQELYLRLHNHFYYERHNEFWRDSALRKLPTLVSATDMMVCGEDLGMIPATVPEVMEREQILSLEIERMPKQMGLSFANPAEYPYMSVCTSSTHDMTTIRGWWREDRALTQRYYNEALGYVGEAPEECSEEIARKIVERQLSSNSMLTILPWQDWMAMEEERNENVEIERINVPANSRHYWRYRVHLNL